MSSVVLSYQPEEEAKGYLTFIREYRRIRKLSLGGSREKGKRYQDPTLRGVLSVGISDDRGQLPFRTTLSTFKLSSPITSYGCIVRFVDSKNWFLCIRRSDTIEYGEFIRGIYRESQLYFILRALSLEERKRLLSYDFETLWLDQMGILVENEIYQWAKKQFERISPHLKELLEYAPSLDPYGKNRWLFPKGRLEYHLGEKGLLPESPWECAQRELREETNNLTFQDLNLLLPNPVQEVFFGSNSKNYATNYFLFETSSLIPPIQFEKRKTPFREITTTEVEEIAWIDEDSLSKYLPKLRLELIQHLPPLERGSLLNPTWNKPVDSSEIPIDEA